MKKISFYLFVIVAFLSGCAGGFPEIKKTGVMEGYIKDMLTEKTIEKAVVRIQDVEYETDSSGFFPLYRRNEKEENKIYIIPKDSGDSYKLSSTGYYERTGIIKFTYGQKNLIGYITPLPGNKKFAITGKVLSASKGALEGATVVINSTFTGMPFKKDTDINGGFSITDIPQGLVNIYVYKNGSESFSKIIQLDDNWIDDSIILKDNSAKTYGTISGQITGFNNEACSYSKVSWGSMGTDSFEYNIADMNGNYILYGIPSGEQYISAKATGFYLDSMASQNKVNVSSAAIAVKNITMQAISGT